METLPKMALSIRQPWAWAIINAGKDVENRPRRFHYRGPICLHASLFNDDGEYTIAKGSVFNASGLDLPQRNQLERGGIVGTAEIVDCVEQSNSPWFFGPYGLVLKNAAPCEFIPVKGQLGLFDWRKNLTKGG